MSRSPTLLLGRVGSGKTATALASLIRRHLIYGRKRTLVLGTVRICNNVWAKEAKRVAPHLCVMTVAETKPTLRCMIMEDKKVDIVCLNYENLVWAVNTYGDKLTQMFPNLIIDESSLIENHLGKRARSLHKILPGFEWRLPMTGTPRGNHLHDLWGNVYLADMGQSLGKYKEAFYQKWFSPVRRTFGTEWIPKVGAKDEIYDRIKPAVHVLPYTCMPYQEIDYVIDTDPVVRGCYAAMAGFLSNDDNEGKDFVYCDTTVIRKGEPVLGKLLQFSSGRVYADNGRVVKLHDAKLDALQEIYYEASGEPIMVVYQHLHEVEAIQGRFPEAVLVDSDDKVDQWNAGEIPMALIHPNSCGHGLNMQFGGYIQVWYTPLLDGELYVQVVGRLNREGVSQEVRIIRLIMEHTEDARAYAIVRSKADADDEAIDRVR